MLFKTNKQTKTSNCQLKILYQWKCSLGMKGKSIEGKLKESFTIRPLLKKWLKEIWETEGKLKKNKFENPQNEKEQCKELSMGTWNRFSLFLLSFKNYIWWLERKLILSDSYWILFLPNVTEICKTIIFLTWNCCEKFLLIFF